MEDITDQGISLQSEDIDLESYEDEDLVELQSELTKKLEFYESENLVFESFLNRMLPGLNNEDLELKKETDADVDKNAGRKKKKNDKKETEKPVLLNLEQKNEISTREMEELRDAIQKEKEDWGKILDNYKVIAIPYKDETHIIPG